MICFNLKSFCWYLLSVIIPLSNSIFSGQFLIYYHFHEIYREREIGQIKKKNS